MQGPVILESALYILVTCECTGTLNTCPLDVVLFFIGDSDNSQADHERGRPHRTATLASDRARAVNGSTEVAQGAVSRPVTFVECYRC